MMDLRVEVFESLTSIIHQIKDMFSFQMNQVFVSRMANKHNCRS